MKQSILLMSLLILVLSPGIGAAGPLNPCTVVATANANTLIQGPTYFEYLPFVDAATFTQCYESAPGFGPTTATIIVANPPQNPPPTAPVYMALNTTGAGVAVTPQVLLTLGTTTINSDQFPDWFPGGTSTTSFAGVTIYSPGTPWVPSSITIIWQ